MKKLSRILNLELAWKRIKKDQYNDILPDILELKDVDASIKETLIQLRKKIDEGYKPSNLLEIDVPKASFTLRPGSNMVPEDRIVYQAVVDYIASHIEEPPAEVCFSYRLNRKKPYGSEMFKFWRPLWLDMRKKMREVYAEGKYCCLLRTDIAAYFEHIDHSILQTNILVGEISNKDILNLLTVLLRKWAISETKHISIPQGCDASSFIGNLYLRDVDKIMIRDGFKYFRYSDELYIFTENERKARQSIKVLTHELRKLHLNLQDAKTDIIMKPIEITEEIGTEEEDKTKDFDYEFKWKPVKGDEEDSKAEIIKRYKEVTRNGRALKVDTSKFRWCINRLSTLRSDKALNFMLSRLAQLPFLADLAFKYLGLFANRKDVKNKIVLFLSSQDNIYAWQEMWLLLILSKAHKLDSKHLAQIRDIIKKKDRHWASRQSAILVLGKLGDTADRNWLKGLYSTESHPQIKRAIAVGLHSLPKAVRNKFYSEIENNSYDIVRLVQYLRQAELVTI